MNMLLFVTVGSTCFDDLIKVLSSEACLDFLKSAGFLKIVFQIGKGNFIPPETSKLTVEWFRYKDSLSDCIKNASLVIGHAGAGTILESLFENKPLIAVQNEKLMDNHQTELAEKLANEGHLEFTTCSNLLGVIKSYNFLKTPFRFQSDSPNFTEILDKILELK